MHELFSMLLDAGLGASALYLASRLTTKVVKLEKRTDEHDQRITVLEKKAA